MAESPSSPFTAAVLCGGSSKRMGRDKAMLLVDGEPMAARVAAALTAAGAEAVVAVGGDPEALAPLGLEVVADDEPGDGPLPATMTALRHLAAARPDVEVVFVASCDLLDPDPIVMAATVRALTDHPGAVAAVPVAAGHRQWMHAAWRVRALAALAAAREAGVTSLRRAAADLLVYDLEGLDESGLADADYPHDVPPGRSVPPAAGSVDGNG